jgi:hypothetical protein
MVRAIIGGRENRAENAGRPIAIDRRGFAARVRGVGARLERVVENLLDNAVSFSAPDAPIEVGLDNDGSWVTLTICDHGPGIPEESREKVFQRFHSVRPDEEDFGNHSGLGLAIARAIAEAHDGTLTAEARADGEHVALAGEKYDHLALPGASLGVMQSAFPAWSEAFWQQLALALVLHPMIHTLVILDHMDCGAYKRLLALGDDAAKEKKAHREITRALAEEVTRRHPGLTVTRWLLEPSPPTQEHDWCARDLQTNKLHHNVKCVHEGS